MNKISLTMVSLVGMSGLVFAQGAATKAPDAKPAGAKVDAKAGAGGATAGAKVDAKADAKAAAPMEMPKPPAEIAAAAKAKTGTWRCTGVGMGGADLKTELKF